MPARSVHLSAAGALPALAALLGLSLLSLPQPPLARGGAGLLTSRPLAPAPREKALAVGSEVRTAAGQRRRALLSDGAVLYVNEKTSVQVMAADRLRLGSGEVFVEAGSAGPDRPVVVETPRREVTARGTHFGVRASAQGTGVVVASGRARVSGVKEVVHTGQQLEPGSDRPVPAPRVSHLLAWTEDLMAQGSAPLVPPSRHAGGTLVMRDPNGQEAKLALRKYHIDVHIEDGFARTTIDQTFFNHTQARLEGTFFFPLPPDASLSRLAMYVDGRLMEGGMAERDYARAVYERIVYQQKDPALLEWVDASTFKMRVFPLESRQEKRLILSYTQKLPTLYGQATYRFPAGHSLERVRTWSFHARIRGGRDLGWNSPSHTLRASKEGKDLLLDGSAQDTRLDRDVLVTLAEVAGGNPEQESVRFSSAEQEGAHYLMLRYRPSLPAQKQRQRRDWVFLFECSGDRDPLLARTQVEVVRGLLANAEADDTFAVLAANTRTRTLVQGCQPVTPENVSAAIRFLEGAHLVGALDLGRALEQAAPLLKGARNPYLVHVGSGIAAMGERRADVLAKCLPEGSHYVGVGVGRRWDRSFMKTAAERTAGYFTQINPDETVSWRTFELASTLNTPRLLDVSVQDREGRAVFLPFARALAQGEELAAVARVGLGVRDLPESLLIRGTLDGQPFERELPVKDVASDAGYLPRTWARLEIERLLADDAAKHRDEVIALSKAMYVMTPYTSLLVLEKEDMYQQFKVDRGRKDHWALYPCPERIPVVMEDEDGRPIDPRRGVKPSAREVLKTILVREAPQVLNGPGQEERRRARLDLDVPPPPAGMKPGEVLARSPEGQLLFGLGVQIDGHLAGEIAFDNRHVDTGTGSLILGKPPAAFQVDKFDVFDSTSRTPEALAVGVEPRSSPNGSMYAIRLEPPGLERLQMSLGPAVNYYDLTRAEGGKSRKEEVILTPLNDAEVEGPPAFTRLAIRGENNQLGYFPPSQALVVRASSRISPYLNLMGRRPVPGRPTRDWAVGFDPVTGRPMSALDDSDNTPSLLYQRPSYSGDDRLYYDLVAYAPGLNTNLADIQAVLEAEAAPSPASKPGTIDEAARALFDRARAAGWQSLVIPGSAARPGFTITFDGAGHYTWERLLPSGLREHVVCDGTTLWHLYPDLGLGACRSSSRFHRLDLARLVPWALPRGEDLAHGADLRVVGERTVALVPHGTPAKSKDGKPLPYGQLQYVFAPDGRLSERQLVEMPAKKVHVREVYTADGAIKHMAPDGKEEAVLNGKLTPSRAPDLKPATDRLVILPLPYRTREHVRKTLGIEKTEYPNLRFEDARALLAADFAAGNGDEALKVFQQALAARDQRQLGYYFLLAACGQNLDSEHTDVLAEHLDEPLAQYLALHSSPVLRKHASQWAVGSNQWGSGLLRRLALAHALCQRWQNRKALGGTEAQRRAELDRALDYVRHYRGTALAWALLGLMEDRAAEDEAEKKDVRSLYRGLAEAWSLFEKVPDLGDAARYEHARCLWKAGRGDEARKSFRDLYESALREGELLRIDADFRAALLGDQGAGWGGLVRATATGLLQKKQRPALLTLAMQCWQVGDQPLANHLLQTALRDLPDQDGLPVRLAGLEFLWRTGQLAEADQLLHQLLDQPGPGHKAVLWRLAAKLAARRDMPVRELECLEHALDAEYQDLPEVINLGTVRSDYERLLNHYQNLAQALETLHVQEPSDFRTKVVRAADRWRALDRDGTEACRLAARVLQTLGDRDLAWDYLTTPVGQQPNQAEPWANLARTLARTGEPVLADRAYQAAFEAEPTNAQLLWDRAENLRQAGQGTHARELYRRLAEGTWPPRFAWIRTQARWQLDNR